MCYEDFLWYILSEEDKTNPTSIKYWFKVIDLDDNGIITPSEMNIFTKNKLKDWKVIKVKLFNLMIYFANCMI